MLPRLPPKAGSEARTASAVSGRGRRWARGGLGIAGIAALLGCGLHATGKALDQVDLPLDRVAGVSKTVVDREGRLLRAFTAPDGRWRLPAAAGDVDPRYLDMLIAYEDRRFRDHAGVDPWSMLRAAGQFVRNGRVVSGASTLTMQVARLLDGQDRRTLGTKVRQMILALALERRLSKAEVLSLYLKLAPFGGNIEGVRAASLAYFRKEPLRLSPGERALLVAIPQSPEARRPDRDPAAARRARDRVLQRAVEAGVVSASEAAQARMEGVPRQRHPFPRLAPHLAEGEVARYPQRTTHRLTLDRARQAALETLAAEHAARLGRKLTVAVLAIENATGHVVAHVGSAGYLDAERQGAIDMTSAVRSPGSTLKPFIYGLAFERGLAHPETLIEDAPTRFGRYAPNNFDEEFRGTVSVREALAHSLNIPAVKALAAVGPKRFVARLRRSGTEVALPPGTEASLAVALGGAGLTLHDLAHAYVALSRGGTPVALVHSLVDGGTGISKPTAKQPARLMSQAAAWYVADILKGAPPPAGAKPMQIAFKTGTSYGYRDAWAVGFDGRHTVAVWVGRADASSTPAMTGHGAAAPLLFDSFARLAERVTPLPPPPAGVQRVRNNELASQLRRFGEGADASGSSGSVAIAFPPDKAELDAPPADSPEIVLKAEGGALPLTWVVDGVPLETAAGERAAVWTPSGSGFSRISVIDATGRADQVKIRIR